MAECLCHMGFAYPDSEGDRLQHLRAVLPCEVRVVAETHPLFGRLLAAKSFKRWNGVVVGDRFARWLAGNDPLRCHRRVGCRRVGAAVGTGRGGAAGAAPVGGAAGDACRSERVGGGSASRFDSSVIAVRTTGG